MTPQQYVAKLNSISQNKLNSLVEILDLTKQQTAVISEDSASQIEQLISLKQIQIDKINELDEEFEVYYSRLKSVLGVQSIEEIGGTQLEGAAELKKTVTLIFNTIKQIQGLEVENKNKVQEIVDNLAADIRRVKQSKMVNNGYNTASKFQQPSYFIDKKK